MLEVETETDVEATEPVATERLLEPPSTDLVVQGPIKFKCPRKIQISEFLCLCGGFGLAVACVSLLPSEPYVDYEHVATEHFLDDYAIHKGLDRATLCVRDCRSSQRRVYWNDETSNKYNQILPGSLFFQGGGGQCPDTECYAVTVAAMSIFQRTGAAEAMLRAPRVISDEAFHGWQQRPTLLNYLYLHERPHRVRAKNAIQSRCGGAPIQERHGQFRDDIRIFDEAVAIGKDSRFGLAMEHSDKIGYVTEKIVNAFLSGSIPIYWGSSTTVNRFFNPRAFINWGRFGSDEEAADFVYRVSTNASMARAILAEPPCREEHMRELFWWRY